MYSGVVVVVGGCAGDGKHKKDSSSYLVFAGRDSQ